MAGIPGGGKNAAKHHSWCKVVLDKFNEEVKSREDGGKTSKFQAYFEAILIQVRSTSSSRILLLTCLVDWSTPACSRNLAAIAAKPVAPFVGCVIDPVNEVIPGCGNCRWAIKGQECKLPG